MTADLTKDSPMKLIVQFAIPFLIGNLFQQFYSFADTLIVGKFLGSNAIAEIGATASIMHFSIGSIAGLMAGFSAITGQKYGGGDIAGIRKSFGISITLTTLFTAVMMLFCLGFINPILGFLNTPSDILQGAHDYIFWIFVGLFASSMFNLLSAMMRALGNSLVPIVFLVIACVVNIILDILFIAVFDSGVAGAGIATFIAQFISAVLCYIYIFKKIPELKVSVKDLVPERTMTVDLLKIGIPMFILNAVICGGDIISNSVNNGLGTLYVASLTASGKIINFIFLPISSFGTALGVYVAQNYGAGEYKRIIKGSNQCMVLCNLWTLAGVIVMFFFGKPLLEFVAGGESERLIESGYYYLLVNTAACVLLSPITVYKYTLNSTGRTLVSMLSGFVEVIFRGGTALLLVKHISFWGIILVNPITWIAVLIPVAIDYFLFVNHLKKVQN